MGLSQIVVSLTTIESGTYRHLTQLAKRGGQPLNFEFVEHHKVLFFALLHPHCVLKNLLIMLSAVCRRQLLRLLLLASRVSGIWMVSSSKHTSFLHKYFGALLACLHPALKFSRTPFRWLSCYIIDLLGDLKCIPTSWPDSRALEMVWHQLRPEVVVFSPPYCIAGQKKKKKNYRIAIGYRESV